MKTSILGLSVLSEHVLRCKKCDTPLVNLVLTETNEKRKERGLPQSLSKYKVDKCYKCGGSSFESKVLAGSVVCGTLRDDVIFDVADTDISDDNVVYVKINTSVRSK